MTHLYLIAGTVGRRPCKVGISENVAGRLRNIQTACPLRHRLMEVWNFGGRIAAQQAEKYAHDFLMDRRLRGEWFDIEAFEAIVRLEDGFFGIFHPAPVVVGQHHGIALPFYIDSNG